MLNCCKFQIISQSQRKLANVFRFKDRLPLDLESGVILPITVRPTDTLKLGLENTFIYHP